MREAKQFRAENVRLLGEISEAAISIKQLLTDIRCMLQEKDIKPPEPKKVEGKKRGKNKRK